MTTPLSPKAGDRASLFTALAGLGQVDLVVIGGGATGLGVALDATLRGLSVVLLESCDFAKGTSSRATKLVHGGVRYLAQGNIGLVREALHERATLLRNAPHLARPLPFVMPSYHCWETPFYGVGLKVYDALAGSAGLGTTRFLSAAQARQQIPGICSQGLKGGVLYWDGQFDDARLALALARTAAAQGALLINYCPVIGLFHEQGRLVGVQCRDVETGREYRVDAHCVVNATGVWVDEVRQMDGAATDVQVQPMVAPSQGVHLVVDREFFPGDHALLVPRTRDGRVLFAVPWLGKVILGTTDTPRHDLAREPLPYAHEINFILGEAARYLSRPPSRRDVRSVWVGLRPLVRPTGDEAGATRKISREHTVLIGTSGLVTVTGGKWTTYRAMAEDVLERCAEAGLLGPLAPSRTAVYPLVGAPQDGGARKSMAEPPGLSSYGTEAELLRGIQGADTELALGLTEAMVRFAARYEYARCVEDVLARRARILFLDAQLATAVAPRVAEILREELAIDPGLDAFLHLSRQYSQLPE
ncbi:FAD-dependent oxidoreductase [Pusillimonas sp. TS35]|uniref:glycerol-3-phosphate dehydrogenase/oxidase n=1 Tax=Paracandidimonas lactea TaxID=2895524 RepID=UPI00136DE173|nr:glycerol-3-phosphate dehydrogenase/oxidase [Paracandidimonas lactea]MYN11615.1 FAD-dependent oxidoreductase [Pusillimonas sp. TS35]